MNANAGIGTFPFCRRPTPSRCVSTERHSRVCLFPYPCQHLSSLNAFSTYTPNTFATLFSIR